MISIENANKLRIHWTWHWTHVEIHFVANCSFCNYEAMYEAMETAVSGFTSVQNLSFFPYLIPSFCIVSTKLYDPRLLYSFLEARFHYFTILLIIYSLLLFICKANEIMSNAHFTS